MGCSGDHRRKKVSGELWAGGTGHIALLWVGSQPWGLRAASQGSKPPEKPAHRPLKEGPRAPTPAVLKPPEGARGWGWQGGTRAAVTRSGWSWMGPDRGCGPGASWGFRGGTGPPRWRVREGRRGGRAGSQGWASAGLGAARGRSGRGRAWEVLGGPAAGPGRRGAGDRPERDALCAGSRGSRPEEAPCRHRGLLFRALGPLHLQLVCGAPARARRGGSRPTRGSGGCSPLLTCSPGPRQLGGLPAGAVPKFCAARRA